MSNLAELQEHLFPQDEKNQNILLVAGTSPPELFIILNQSDHLEVPAI